MKTDALTRECPICGKTFSCGNKGGGRQKYCSQTCARRANARWMHKRISDNSHKGYIAHELLYIYGGRCALCGWRATEELISHNRRTQYAYGNEIHHLIPVRDGGRATFDNLILLCPNHHKQADLGLIPLEELRKHLKPQLSDEEKHAMRNRCIDAIAKVIWEEYEDDVPDGTRTRTPGQRDTIEAPIISPARNHNTRKANK